MERKYFSINRLERSSSRSCLPLKYNVRVPHAHAHVRDRVELKIGITNKLNMLNALFQLPNLEMKYHNLFITCKVQTHYN